MPSRAFLAHQSTSSTKRRDGDWHPSTLFIGALATRGRRLFPLRYVLEHMKPFLPSTSLRPHNSPSFQAPFRAQCPLNLLQSASICNSNRLARCPASIGSCHDAGTDMARALLLRATLARQPWSILQSMMTSHGAGIPRKDDFRSYNFSLHLPLQPCFPSVSKAEGLAPPSDSQNPSG